MTPEKIVQNAIVSYFTDLANAGYPVYIERRQAGGYSYKMGIPDLYGICKGRHIEIECKAPGKELRPMQEKQKQKFEKVGAFYICADSLDDVKVAMLQEFNISLKK